MAILLADKELHWLPNHQIFRKYLNDICLLGDSDFPYIKQKAKYALDSYSYLLNYEDSAYSSIVELLEATERVINFNTKEKWDDLELRSIYINQLENLKTNISCQIQKIS